MKIWSNVFATLTTKLKIVSDSQVRVVILQFRLIKP